MIFVNSFVEEKLNLQITSDVTQSIHRIQVRIDDIKTEFDRFPEVQSLDEAYVLRISPQNVAITGQTDSGVFYGIQSLLSLLETNSDRVSLPLLTVVDAPRKPFRGLMLDVARNFIDKKNILRIMEVMAMYKMNKLHLHLTDDQGWRIEVPGVPVLTQVANLLHNNYCL
jgi:hexosaminidase